MDGTGPRFGNRPHHGGGHHGRAGYGRHSGTGRGFYGCRCGLSPCAQNAPDDKQSLTLQKAALQRSLNTINKRLETME